MCIIVYRFISFMVLSSYIFGKSMILISENDDISIKKTSIHKIFNLNY